MKPFLLLAPVDNFYAYLLEGLSDGFARNGYPCAWLNVPIEQNHVAAWARQVEAHAVLEINRVLAPDVGWPADVAHLAWMQDYRASENDLTADYGRGHHLYFLLPPSAFGVSLPPDRPWSVLSPGARADGLAPPPAPAEMACDFSMIGFIPPPVREDLPIAKAADGRVVTFAALLRAFPPEKLRHSDLAVGATRAALADTCRRLGCTLLDPAAALRLFDETLVRIVERKQLMEAVLGISRSVNIYGAGGWAEWPQFAPYCRGFVDPHRSGEVYRTTRVNLHNGQLAMHVRVIDCLAVGGFVLVNKTPLDRQPGGIAHFFEAGRHYGEYPPDDVGPAAQYYLEDADARQRIAAEGRRAVLAGHTWVHRAAQILRDLGLPVREMTRLSEVHAVRQAAADLNASFRASLSRPPVAAAPKVDLGRLRGMRRL